MEKAALFKLSYGLFVLTSKDGAKDNGCIINTVQQVTDSPKRISIAVNKNNYTHDQIVKTGVFNVSVLSTDVRTENGLIYLAENTNAVISAKVIETVEYESHTVFFADVEEARVLSGAPSMTYEYYFANVKPKPAPAAPDKKGYVCKICGWVYEGDELPADIVCPLCKHGADDFEKLA